MKSSDRRFNDKVVLVTGAVRNTGLALADAFAGEGAVVALNGRDPLDVAREAQRLRERHGGRVLEVPADVSRQDEVDAMFAVLRRETGRLDVLVNNAVVQAVGHAFVDTPRDVLERAFAVNVFGVYACSQCAARMMCAERSGAIVNIGSNTAERAIRNRTAYVASKGAIEALTRAMAVELGPSGVRVNLVMAGYIRTDRWDSLPDAVRERRRANLPMGEEASGRDVADAVLFLASDAASRIVGACLAVDGGASSQLVPLDCDR